MRAIVLDAPGTKLWEIPRRDILYEEHDRTMWIDPGKVAIDVHVELLHRLVGRDDATRKGRRLEHSVR